MSETSCAEQRNKLARRLRYIARFAYYLAIHRSFSSARWCLAHEGITWN